MWLPPSFSPKVDRRPFPGAMTGPVGGSSTKRPRSPRAPIAPRSVKRMKNRRSGSASYIGIPVSKFNCARIPLPVIASPSSDACKYQPLLKLQILNVKNLNDIAQASTNSLSLSVFF